MLCRDEIYIPYIPRSREAAMRFVNIRFRDIVPFTKKDTLQTITICFFLQVFDELCSICSGMVWDSYLYMQ